MSWDIKKEFNGSIVNEAINNPRLKRCLSSISNVNFGFLKLLDSGLMSVPHPAKDQPFCSLGHWVSLAQNKLSLRMCSLTPLLLHLEGEWTTATPLAFQQQPDFTVSSIMSESCFLQLQFPSAENVNFPANVCNANRSTIRAWKGDAKRK